MKPFNKSTEATLPISFIFRLFTLSILVGLLTSTQSSAQYPNAYASEIDWYYYNAQTVFATYPGYTLGAPYGATINGDLGGNPFTVNFTNLANLGNGGYGGAAARATGQGVTIAPPNWGPYIGRINSNLVSPSQGNYVDLTWRGSGTSGAATAIPPGSTGTATFASNLSVLDQFIVGDLGDGGETAVFEFLDASGNPVNIQDNVRLVHLTNDAAGQSVPVTYPTSTSIALDAGVPVTNVVNEGWAFVMLTNNVRSVRFTQTGSISFSAGNSWSFTFAKGATDSGDAPASYGGPNLFPLGGLLRLGAHGGDTEYTTLSSPGADGDNNANSNDEDGVATLVSIPNNGTPGQVISSYTVNATASNSSGAAANAIAWIDWNGNGTFDAGEASAPVPVATGSSNLPISFTWNNMPLTGAAGLSGTFLRIILTGSPLRAADAATSFAPASGIGEIEDYFIPFDAPLPVSLTTFTAKADGNNAKLEWTTASERNNAFFEVQHSLNARTFETVGTVKGNGTTQIKHAYAYTDANLTTESVHYYRLKQVDADGKFSYSQTRSVQLEGYKGILLQVTPNPATNRVVRVTVDFGDEALPADAQLSITDINGRPIEQQSAMLKKGINSFSFPLGSRPSGIYLVTLRNAGLKKPIVQKIVIQ